MAFKNTRAKEKLRSPGGGGGGSGMIPQGTIVIEIHVNIDNVPISWTGQTACVPFQKHPRACLNLLISTFVHSVHVARDKVNVQ